MLPDPEGKGLHPLVLRSATPKWSRNPSVGDAQKLLNSFLTRLRDGCFVCKPGVDMTAIQAIRKSLSADPMVVDCRFGPDTQKATLMFQRCVFPGNKKAWDGKIGPNTWPELVKLRAIDPPLPTQLTELLTGVRVILGGLPLGKAGVVLPSDVRFLDPAEQSEARCVYQESLDFTKILISNGLGFLGRPFTVAVQVSTGWHVVMNLGDLKTWVPVAIGYKARAKSLIHELAHAWQSQHHSSDPEMFMKNSVACQLLAIADLAAAKADAARLASGKAFVNGERNPLTLASIAKSAAAAEDVSEYAYIPRKPFREYAAEQIAQQVEDTYAGTGRPTPSIVGVISAVAPNAHSVDNEESLKVTKSSFHRSSEPLVVFPP